MLICRNRSKALMADQDSLIISPKKPISTFLSSPRVLNGLLTIKSLSHAEMTIMSPTSTLNSSNFENPFGKKQNSTKNPTFETNNPSDNTKSEPKAIGLALIDSLIEEKSDDSKSSNKPINRMGLFGSKLKVQIPCQDLSFSPVDFGIKTKNSCQTALGLSPSFCETEGPSEKGFNRQLSLKEMELSEDYTCVITHGPKPKTTHIFDNCIVECCCGDVEDVDPNIICIHMVRGEEGFGRHEWACEEMEMDGTENTKVG